MFYFNPYEFYNNLYVFYYFPYEFYYFPYEFYYFPYEFYNNLNVCYYHLNVFYYNLYVLFYDLYVFFTAISMGMIRKSRLLPSKVSKFRLERKVLTSVKTVNSFCLILTRNSLKSLNQFSHFPNARVSLFVCLGIPLPSVQTTPAYVCDFD